MECSNELALIVYATMVSMVTIIIELNIMTCGCGINTCVYSAVSMDTRRCVSMPVH